MIAEKVRAYIFRENDQGIKELLVFNEPDFPEAGVQVPGGTVDPGEDEISALVREVFEESGKKIDGPWKKILREKIIHPENGNEQFENIYRSSPDEKLPETWDHTVTGGGEDEGILFRYYWLSIESAAKELWPWMSQQLKSCIDSKSL